MGWSPAWLRSRIDRRRWAKPTVIPRPSGCDAGCTGAPGLHVRNPPPSGPRWARTAPIFISVEVSTPPRAKIPAIPHISGAPPDNALHHGEHGALFVFPVEDLTRALSVVPERGQAVGVDHEFTDGSGDGGRVSRIDGQSDPMMLGDALHLTQSGIEQRQSRTDGRKEPVGK